MPRTLNLGAVATAAVNFGEIATVPVVDEGELNEEQVEKLRIYGDVDSDEKDESGESDFLGAAMDAAVEFPELMDEPNAPSLPSAEVMWSYYRRELPRETLQEYDLNCVKFKSWQKARADMAKQRLVEAKQRGDLLDLDPPIHVTARDGIVSATLTGDQVEDLHISDEPIWDDAVERKKDEDAYAVELKIAQDKLIEAAMECDDAKGRLKDAKSYEKLSLDYLKSLVVNGVRYRKKPEPKPADQVDPETGEVIPAVATMGVASSEWRSWETASILDGIEGLGAKKRDALLESFPTFGKLMDARTEAGKEHVPFHSLLPKGIGESIGTELIDRMDKKIVPGF